jgi:glyoxylase-like metal-dependent hydrolase (beta-lactamase superfamily II)
VRKPTRPREVGRGERVLPGAWRLRLPLPFHGVPHCNAWALSAGDGIVLVDTGVHQRGSMADLERALLQAGRTVEDVRLVVLTHAHVDHCGQAPPIAERAGCEVWIHPAFRTHAAGREDGEGATGQAGTLRSDRDLLPGVEIETDLGTWEVLETPGHAPSHVCLHQPERRLLISGDHLLGRVSLYFDVGYTPDPVGEFLHSLDVVAGLDARLALAGHARPFTDVEGHVQANRELVARRLDTVRGTLAAGGPHTAEEVARAVYGETYTEEMAGWLLTKARAWLTHLAVLGEAAHDGGSPERWLPNS